MFQIRNNVIFVKKICRLVDTACNIYYTMWVNDLKNHPFLEKLVQNGTFWTRKYWRFWKFFFFLNSWVSGLNGISSYQVSFFPFRLLGFSYSVDRVSLANFQCHPQEIMKLSTETHFINIYLKKKNFPMVVIFLYHINDNMSQQVKMQN